MSVGKIGRNSNGRLWRRSGGKVGRATGAEPCCCAATPCSNCVSNTTKRTATVTFAEVMGGCGCVIGQSLLTIRARATGVLSGTFDLPQTQACRYAVRIPAADFPALNVEYWPGDWGGNHLCSSPPNVFSFYAVDIYIDFISNNLLVSALSVNKEPAELGGGLMLGPQLFMGALTLARPYDCSSPRTVQNDNHFCYGGTSPDRLIVNFGGAAHVTFT